MGFFLAPIAIAAVMAAAAALVGAGLAIQIVVFILVSAASLASCARSRGATCTRPRGCARAPLRWWASRRPCWSVWTPTAAGEARRRGVDRARLRRGRRAFEPGQRVQVLKIEGATALVHE